MKRTSQGRKQKYNVQAKIKSNASLFNPPPPHPPPLFYFSHLAFFRALYFSSFLITMYIDSASTQPGLRWLRLGLTPSMPPCSELLISENGNATFFFFFTHVGTKNESNNGAN